MTDFGTLVDRLITDTLGTSLGHFAPELALCTTIVSMLLVRLFSADRWLPAYWVALIGSLVAFVFSYLQFTDLRQNGGGSELFFNSILIYDSFTVFFSAVLVAVSGSGHRSDGLERYSRQRRQPRFL